jgi:hypothetical protein
MRVFDTFNDSEGTKPCPICGTKAQKSTILIGIMGSQEGFTIEALQVHYDCYIGVLQRTFSGYSGNHEIEPLIMPDKGVILLYYKEALQ